MSRKLLWMICCAILCTALLTGCKDTDVLKEIVYQDDQEFMDHSQQTVDNDERNTEEDENLYSQKEEDTSDQKRDTDDSLAVEDTTADDNPSVSVDPGEDSTSSPDSTGNTGSTSSESKSGSKKKSSADNDNDEPDFDKNKAALDDDENNGENDGSGDNPSSSGNGSKMTDANGKEIEVPERVDTVTAVDETAMLVEMLGGEGRLVGSSESVTGNTLASQIFSDFSQIKTWWSGNGKNGISAQNFQSLLAASPQLCFIVSGENTFSTAQIAALNNKNIICVTLYPFNTPEHIRWNVTLMGQILGDQSLESGKKDAVSIAKKYVSWSKSVENDFANSHYCDYTLTKYLDGESSKWNSRGNGQYSLLVQHWDDSASVKIYSNDSQGMIDSWGGGAGAADSGYSDSPVSYYMSIAGVVNTAAAESAIEKLSNSFSWYVNQWINDSCIVKIQGKYNDYRASGNYSGPLLAQLAEDKIQTNLMSHLGSSNFKVIIAGSNSIANKLTMTKLMQSYPYVTDSGGGYYGFSYSNNLVMRSSIVGGYDIDVNPYGLSCWYEGSAESPLEAYWISARFGTAGHSMTNVEGEIRSFYKTFYNYDLNDSQIQGIMEGDYVPSCREE